METHFLGVRLGSSLQKVKSDLNKTVGPFVKEDSFGPDRVLIYRTAKSRSPEGSVLILATPKEGKLAGVITSLTIDGNDAVPGFNFPSGLNLGMPESFLDEKFIPASDVRESGGGYKQYTYANTNFTIETLHGRVRSIRIGLENTFYSEPSDDKTILVLNESLARALGNNVNELSKSKDLGVLYNEQLKTFCQDRFPVFMDRQTGLPILRTFINFGPVKKAVTFLVDTGHSKTALSNEFTKTLKTTPKFQMNLGSVTKELNYSVDQDLRYIKKDVDVDGVLGGDFFTSEEIILNLKHEYICFPKKPIAENWKNLGFSGGSKVDYDHGHIWAALKINGKLTQDYFLDTGSDTTSLSSDDIKRAKLSLIAIGKKRVSKKGEYLSDAYGPVQLEWAGLQGNLKSVSMAPRRELFKIGHDFFGSLIFAFDPKNKLIYMAK